MKATNRKTGVHGRSKIAAMAGVLIVARIESKSRIAWPRTRIRRHHLLQDSRRDQGIDALPGADQQPVTNHVQRREGEQRERKRERDE